MSEILSPDHYTWHPVAECRDIAEHFDYNLGTAIAYIWRAGLKTPDRKKDLLKAIQHLSFEVDREVAAAREASGLS